MMEFTYLLTMSLCNGTIPSEWKTSKVHIPPKNGLASGQVCVT